MGPGKRTNQEGRRSENQEIHAIRDYGVGGDELRAEEVVPRDIAHSCVHAASQASNFPDREPNFNNFRPLQPYVNPDEEGDCAAEAS